MSKIQSLLIYAAVAALMLAGIMAWEAYGVPVLLKSAFVLC